MFDVCVGVVGSTKNKSLNWNGMEVFIDDTGGTRIGIIVVWDKEVVGGGDRGWTGGD